MARKAILAVLLAFVCAVCTGCKKNEVRANDNLKPPTPVAQKLPQITAPVATPPQQRVPTSATQSAPTAYQTPPAIAEGDRWFQQQVAESQRQQAAARQTEAQQWESALQQEKENIWKIRNPQEYREFQEARAAEMERQRILANPLCGMCKGKGWHSCYMCVQGQLANGDTCPACNGQGWMICEACDGTGHVLE